MASTATLDTENQAPRKALTEGSSVYDALPDDVRLSLTPEQEKQVKGIALTQNWKRHPLDIRLNLPFIGGGYYLTIIGGKENRSHERRTSERQNYPLKTVANTFFFVGFGAFLGVLTIIAMALQSAIIEF